ncbi:hypothetical protein BD770DRAFT_449705 [Pilaira anomala]|nr:hypothetical protein BD770DRAFT_449705 [Pilaira anomala]
MNSDSCHITGNVIVTVNARSIRAEVRASDSGVNLKIYAVGLQVIYYLVRFEWLKYPKLNLETRPNK